MTYILLTALIVVVIVCLAIRWIDKGSSNNELKDTRNHAKGGIVAKPEPDYIPTYKVSKDQSNGEPKFEQYHDYGHKPYRTFYRCKRCKSFNVSNIQFFAEGATPIDNYLYCEDCGISGTVALSKEESADVQSDEQCTD